jgi:hypothetical protein
MAIWKASRHETGSDEWGECARTAEWTNLSVLPLLALMVWTASGEVARPVRAVALTRARFHPQSCVGITSTPRFPPMNSVRPSGVIVAISASDCWVGGVIVTGLPTSTNAPSTVG